MSVCVSVGWCMCGGEALVALVAHPPLLTKDGVCLVSACPKPGLENEDENPYVDLVDDGVSCSHARTHTHTHTHTHARAHTHTHTHTHTTRTQVNHEVMKTVKKLSEAKLKE